MGYHERGARNVKRRACSEERGAHSVERKIRIQKRFKNEYNGS